MFVQYGRLSNLNQRELANAGAELGRTIENAIGTIRHAGEQDSGSKIAEPKSKECVFDEDQPYLSFFPACKDAPADFLKNVDFKKSVDFKTAKALTLATGGKVELRFLPDVLLGELSFPELFRLLVLVEDSGLVLYQDEPERRHWRRWLRWGEQRFMDSTADGGLRIRNLAEALPDGQEARWQTLRSTTSRTTLSLGGEWHQVYLQPVALSTGQNLTLVGAVPTAQLVWQALALDTLFYAILVFLLLLGVAGIPFVKLIALHKHERFRMRDVYFLYLSSGALLAVLTLVAMGWDAYREWGAFADKGFKPLAAELQQQFQKEVSAVRDQLTDYDKKVSDQKVSALTGRSCDSWMANNDWFNPEKDNRGQFALPLPDPQRHIYLETAGWVSYDGMQVWKTTASKVTTKLDVHQRPYYLAVRDKYLFKIDGENGKKNFFISPDRSISDGKFKTFISMPSDLNKEFCAEDKNKGPYTAVAVLKFLSLDRVPLPAGYGFVVVNREGGVLYHSDARLSLRENFFSEISDASSVKALMYAGQSENPVIRSRYRERPYSFLVQPLGIHPQSEDKTESLHLVVFRDRSVEMATVAHALVIGIGVTVVVLFALMLLAIPWIPALKRRKMWLWPHGGLSDYHRSLTFAFLGVLIAELVLSRWSPGIVVLMPIATGIAAVAVGLSRNWKVQRQKMQTRLWHNSEIVLMSLCIVIVPSAALFRLTMDHDIGRMIVTERKWIQDQKEDIGLALRAEERAEGYPDKIGDSRVMAREAYLSSDPAPYDTDKASMSPSSFVTFVHEWSDRNLPAENDTIARYRHQEQSARYSQPGVLPNIGSAGLAGLAVTIGLLLWWVQWNTKGLFYGDLDSSKVAPPVSQKQCEAAWSERNEDEKILLIQVAREHIANPRQKPLVTHLLEKGLLKLVPDLQPGSEEFAEFLLIKEQEMGKELQESEKVAERHSWRYVRLILFIGLGGLGLFLGATQPGWQSALLGFASATTGLLSAFFKLQDTILQWIRKPTHSG